MQYKALVLLSFINIVLKFRRKQTTNFIVTSIQEFFEASQIDVHIPKVSHLSAMVQMYSDLKKKLIQKLIDICLVINKKFYVY